MKCSTFPEMILQEQLRIICVVCLFSLVPGCTALDPLEKHPTRLEQVQEGFRNPPSPFRPAPLYVWNDDMQKEEIARQLDGFKAQGFGGVFVHPRPGLVTPYLSDEWLDLWKFTVEECVKRGMKAYIYDENSYPSGFAGGHVPEAMPESRQVILRRELFTLEQAERFPRDRDLVAVFRIEGSGPADRVRLVVNRDGQSGFLSIGGMGAPRFRFLQGPFRGGVGFRTIVGRNVKVDDVRFFQEDEDGEIIVLLEDDFNRAELGPGWIKESLVAGADGSALNAAIEDGVLVLEHDGTMNDAWLRTSSSVEFKGRTTVFEFTLKERFGDVRCNPALAVGTRPFAPGETGGVMLVDTNGPDPHYTYGMVRGAWHTGQAAPEEPDRRFEGMNFERVDLSDEPAFELGEGTYLKYHLQYGGTSAWLGGRHYVDLLRPGVGKKFLEITLGAYDRILADEYGRSVLACFTDEPHIRGGWTPSLPEFFERRYGYSILDHLPSLHMEAGAWRGVRHDYSEALLDLYLEHFVRPYAEACEERGIAFTGHVWEHDWPNVGSGPDGMSFAALQGIPGIDCLMNRYSEGTNAQFGNVRAVSEVRSIANQLGRRRVLCEAYGASGWEATLQDFKRIGDWLLAGGVNLLNPHLSYYSIRGARKADHPPSFSHHAPWWEAHHVLGDYFGRLCWALAAGRERNDLLVIEPTTTMWMYNWSGSCRGRLSELGAAFQEYVTGLAAAQVRFDLGSEPVMAGIGEAQGGRLRVGERSYSAVVLPPGLENLERSTMRLLERFAEEGGVIVSCAGVPGYVNGREDEAPSRLKEIAGDLWIEGGDPSRIREAPWYDGRIRLEVDPPEDGRVYHLLRELDDGCLLFIVNTSLEDGARGFAEAPGRSVERWVPETGAALSIPCSKSHDRVTWNFTLPPGGSRLFAVDAKPKSRVPPPDDDAEAGIALSPLGPMEIRPERPNVLPLDFMDLVVDGKTYEGIYRAEAQTRVFKAHGMDRNCWDRAVQFQDEIIKRDDFPRDSGFELRYPFRLEGFAEMPRLEVVVEQGDRYEASVNGHTLVAKEGSWWLDRSFRVYTVDPSCLREGENVLSVKTGPFSLHLEPEPAYVLGDFSLEAAERGWRIVPAKAMALGAWSRQGRPFYSNGVGYSLKYRCAPEEGKRFFVVLREWKGTAVRVEVNGKKAGYLAWRPWRIEVTDYIVPGENRITVTVFGSLKNLLGPHHRDKVRGSAWPNLFLHAMDGQPPGKRYDVMEYGIERSEDVALLEFR